MPTRFGFDLVRWQAAKAEAQAILVDHARRRQTITYGELQASARNAEYNSQNYLGPENFLTGNEKAGYNAQGYLTVSGDVVNKMQQPAHFVRVTVTILDEQGRVVGADSAYVEKPDLLPGESSHYEVTFFTLAGNAGRFVTRIEGRLNP